MNRQNQTGTEPTHDFINMVISNHFPNRNHSGFVNPKLLSCAILVHVTIADKVINALSKQGIIIDPKIFEYDLQIHGKYFDMRIISIQYSKDTVEIVHEFIMISQLSFPWEDNPTLFISVKDFNVLQGFIKKYYFEPYIIKIEEQTGFSVVVGHDIIKVVTFNQNAHRLNIIQQFAIHLIHYRIVNKPWYYFTLYAFQWLQPHWLDHFKIPIDDSFYRTFYIILNHLGYNDGLNIFDLLMLRIALCDYRNPLPSGQVKYEIDFFIKRELSKFVKNEHLDIDRYLVVKNYTQIDCLINYMIYEFQNYFSTITRKREFATIGGSIKATINKSKIRDNIELTQDNSCDVLKQIKEKFNVKFTVNGSKCDQICLSLFLDLLECPNVNIIYLNTNSTWTKDDCELNRSIISGSDDEIMHVYLDGENTANFIEDFVSSLKMITFSKGRMVLYIAHNLNDYTVFDNLPVHKIYLKKIKIDNRMLNDFNKCELKSKIIIENSTFENTLPNWKLLYDVRESVIVKVHEDEGTFESMFTFIAEHLNNSKTKEFQFDTYHFFQVICGAAAKVVSFNEIKFVVDDVGSKLELRDNFSKKIIDLYELKNGREPNEKSNYDFYQ